MNLELIGTLHRNFSSLNLKKRLPSQGPFRLKSRMPLDHATGQAQAEYGPPRNNRKKAAWLDQDCQLDAFKVSQVKGLSQLADDLLAEMGKNILRNDTKDEHKRSRVKYALQVILGNLYKAYLVNAPLRYSRRSNDYTRNSRYGRLHFKYDMTRDIFDALKKHRYLKRQRGYYSQDKQGGKITRDWATKKLTDKFDKLFFLSFRHNEQEENEKEGITDNNIILKDDKKNEIDIEKYNYNNIRYQIMKDFIFRYNEFISDFKIESKAYIDINVSYVKLLKLSNNIFNSNIQLIDINNTNYNNNIIINNIYNLYYNYIRYYLYHNTISEYTITDRNITIINNRNYSYIQDIDSFFEHSFKSYHEKIKILSDALKEAYRKTLIEKLSHKGKYFKSKKVEFTLGDLGISNIHLLLKKNSLHRVFNKSSWNKGGRFYGAAHLSIPKQFRKCITINGCKTVEPDYSALHIRMAYQMEGIDYHGDPYEEIAETDEERGIYKILALVLINAENLSKAIKGFRKEMWDEGVKVDTTDANIKKMIDRFRQVHKSIVGYIHSGAGRTLQNLDGQITEGILMKLMSKGIPCLPVHDSYRVPEQYRDMLMEAMEKEYVKVMGYDPVIDCKD